MIPGEEPEVLTVTPGQVEHRHTTAEQLKEHGRELAALFNDWEHMGLIISRGLKRPVEILMVWNE